jgi:hypothetical protein
LLEHPGSFKPLVEAIVLNFRFYEELRWANEVEAASQLPERIQPDGPSMGEEVVTRWFSLGPVSHVMNAKNP